MDSPDVSLNVLASGSGKPTTLPTPDLRIPESPSAAAAMIPWYEAQLRVARERARETARIAGRLHGELSVLRDVARGEFEPDDRPYWPVNGQPVELGVGLAYCAQHDLYHGPRHDWAGS